MTLVVVGVELAYVVGRLDLMLTLLVVVLLGSIIREVSLASVALVLVSVALPLDFVILGHPDFAACRGCESLI
jgi:hypothetical protein